jgi:phage terminase small subunit
LYRTSGGRTAKTGVCLESPIRAWGVNPSSPLADTITCAAVHELQTGSNKNRGPTGCDPATVPRAFGLLGREPGGGPGESRGRGRALELKACPRSQGHEPGGRRFSRISLLGSPPVALSREVAQNPLGRVGHNLTMSAAENVRQLPPKRAKPPEPPKHLSQRSREVWRSVVKEWALGTHELRLLELACTSLDRAEEARQALAANGLTVLDRFGQEKPRPEVGIERDAKVTAARLFRELRLGDEEAEEARPPRLGRPSTVGGGF